MGPGNSDFCHGNVMEKSWNFVLEKLYEPLTLAVDSFINHII